MLKTLHLLKSSLIMTSCALILGGCIENAETPQISAAVLPNTENAVVADDGRLYIATTNKVYSLSNVAPDDLEVAFSSPDCPQITGLTHSNNYLYIACIRDINTSWFEHKGEVHILNLADLSREKIELEQTPMLANGMSIVNKQLYISNSYLPLSDKLDEIIRVSLNTEDFGKQYTALAKRPVHATHPNGLQSYESHLYYIDGSHFNHLILDDAGKVKEVEVLASFKGIADDFTIKNGIAYIALFTLEQRSVVEFELSTKKERKRHPTIIYLASSLVWFKDVLYATSYVNGGLYKLIDSFSVNK